MAGGNSLGQLLDVFVSARGGKNQPLADPQLFGDLGRRSRPVEKGRRDVHDDDVGHKLLGEWTVVTSCSGWAERWLSSRKDLPLSEISMRIPHWNLLRSTLPCEAFACLATLVRLSCATRYNTVF